MTSTITLTERDVEEITGKPFTETRHNCHAVSLAIVRSGRVPGARVARGVCRGVFAQHSWVVVGDDCYAPDARIIDPTLWSYDDSVTGVWHGSAADGRHTPHGGHGDIWSWGRPQRGKGDVIELTPTFELSRDAELFLELLGPLDRKGWAILTSAPVGGWPAVEILAAMHDTPQVSALVPIDLIGMLTDRNPGGLYLPGAEKTV